jgi:hypothetical protein
MTRERRSALLALSQREKRFYRSALIQAFSPLNQADFPASGWRSPHGLPIWRPNLGFRRRPMRRLKPRKAVMRIARQIEREPSDRRAPERQLEPKPALPEQKGAI